MKRGFERRGLLEIAGAHSDDNPRGFTTHIVHRGLPGRNENDFEELCDFVRAANLDWMGVFEYSDVDNAGSYALEEKVDAETISDRRHRLMAIQKKISRENLRARYLRTTSRASKKRTFMALIEGPSKDNPLVWEARLEGMAPEIDGKLYLTDIELPAEKSRKPATSPALRLPRQTRTT